MTLINGVTFGFTFYKTLNWFTHHFAHQQHYNLSEQIKTSRQKKASLNEALLTAQCICEYIKALFYILDLLTHLFNQHLKLYRTFSDLAID